MTSSNVYNDCIPKILKSNDVYEFCHQPTQGNDIESIIMDSNKVFKFSLLNLDHSKTPDLKDCKIMEFREGYKEIFYLKEESGFLENLTSCSFTNGQIPKKPTKNVPRESPLKKEDKDQIIKKIKQHHPLNKKRLAFYQNLKAH